ncbi:MAG: hypothetical protein ABI276_03605, partial [Acidimicrobiales bacterium]
MSSSAAVPFDLLALAAGQRRTAEELLEAVAPFQEMLGRLRAGSDSWRVTAVGDPCALGRSFGGGLLDVSDWVATVG